jgi:hypothetical protein
MDESKGSFGPSNHNMVGEKQLGIHGSPKKPLCWDVEDKDARNF